MASQQHRLLRPQPRQRQHWRSRTSSTRKESHRLCDRQRPKVLNALNTPTWKDLRTAFEAAQDDIAVRGVILTGAVTRPSSPAPTSASSRTSRAFEAEQSSRFGQAVLDLIENLGKPVIAAINGFALGGGAKPQWRAASGSRSTPRSSASPKCTRTASGRRRNQRLPRLVGKGRALQLILSGEMINVQEAYRIGLVNEIVPAPSHRRAEAILKKIGANAPIAVKLSLEAVNKGLETGQEQGLLLEAAYFGLCAATEDKKEGTSAFLEKRTPHFRGR